VRKRELAERKKRRGGRWRRRSMRWRRNEEVEHLAGREVEV